MKSMGLLNEVGYSRSGEEALWNFIQDATLFRVASLEAEE
jgi:hypothetical protein